MLYFLQHAAYFWSTLVTFQKIRGLVIWDWYFSGRMEIISTEEKVKERKECRNIVQKLCVHTGNEQMNKR